tara:strand:+ start:745 stop:1875 length:1131 start_codon:yes stop_codon:yes gene_type:complete
MKKVLVAIGTRPEAIKMAPLIKMLDQDQRFDLRLCITAQHRSMLDQVLNIFNIKPDFDLNLMTEGQELPSITTSIIDGMTNIFNEFNPDLLLVHGDTTTTFACALSAYYKKIPVGHIEAGLRTRNIYSPWPEEANRQLTSIVANYHFCPTDTSRQNLIDERVKEETIFVTGNTVIDALKMALDRVTNDSKLIKNIENTFQFLDPAKKTVLVTGHRRENFGHGFLKICEAIKHISSNNNNLQIIYPVHLNPNVQEPVSKILSGIDNVHLLEPLGYLPFVYLMNRCDIILTDSGGIQEEAPSLGKPVLVMRESTERPEGINAGTVKLVGTDAQKIISEVEMLLYNEIEYQKMSRLNNPYGDGKACERICNILGDINDI